MDRAKHVGLGTVTNHPRSLRQLHAHRLRGSPEGRRLRLAATDYLRNHPPVNRGSAISCDLPLLRPVDYRS